MTGSDPRRVVSAGAVLLLHLLVIAAFVEAIRVTSHVPAVTQDVEVFFPARAHRPQPLPENIPPHLMRPEMPKAVAPAIPPATPSITGVPSPGAISGVGRALFGCAPEKLDRLSPEARTGCLSFSPGKPHERSVRLGPPPDPNSPFTKELEQRFRHAQPINRPCPPGSYNDTRGLPCFGFDQEAPLLQGR
jgi:hypothetical protein